jgi:hypothetical protein
MPLKKTSAPDVADACTTNMGLRDFKGRKQAFWLAIFKDDIMIGRGGQGEGSKGTRKNMKI